MKKDPWERGISRRARIEKRGLLETDKSERFVLRTCIGYMERLLRRSVPLDSDAFAMLLGHLDRERYDAFVQHLVMQFSDSKREDFLNEITDAEPDLEAVAEVIQHAVKRLSQGRQKQAARLLFRHIEARRLELRYRGASRVEKCIDAFQGFFQLTEQEKIFLTFLYIVSTHELAENYFVAHLECHKVNRRKYMAEALGLSQAELNGVMKGTLFQIGAFEMDRYTLVLEDGFLNFVLDPSPEALSKYYFTPDTSTGVPLEDHFLEKDRMEYVINLLNGEADQPVNLLLYGPGGTGKTSFAYGICRKLRVPVYEIARNAENESGMRRAALHACLNLAANQQGTIVLVDEADNVLNTRFSFFMRGETQDKGWLNQVLERKGARVIWITNDIGNIEEPVRRRFSYSLHFKPFNKSQRMRLWEHILQRNKVKRFVSSSEISRLAKTYQVSAGAIDMAVKKAVQVDAKSKSAFIRAVTLNLDSHEALMNDGEKPRKKDPVEENYTLNGLNIAGDIHSILQQAVTFGEYLGKTQARDKRVNMNFLFYGPPGTGKSALARYIADHVGREIMTRRASDILNPYVGMTEQTIRKAFEEAEREEAVLVIDEIDSMLFSRDRAQRSWEVSFTNEFLTQMEIYRGFLICTTNRLTDLDPASLRRFNHKIGFDYLTPDGKVVFYDKLLTPLVGSPVPGPIKGRLRRIPKLAPGDFKVVRDKARFGNSDHNTHENMLSELIDESEVKRQEDRSNEIGFKA